VTPGVSHLFAKATWDHCQLYALCGTSAAIFPENQCNFFLLKDTPKFKTSEAVTNTGLSNCITATWANANCDCTRERAIVCGDDGTSYLNKCWAECSGAKVAHDGACHKVGESLAHPSRAFERLPGFAVAVKSRLCKVLQTLLALLGLEYKAERMALLKS
jgi:hypothetical protein